MLATYAYQIIEEMLKSMPDSANFMEIGSYDGEGISSLAKKFPKQKFYSIDPFIEDGNTSHLTQQKKGQEIDKIFKRFRLNTNGLKNIVHYKFTSERFIDLYYNMLPSISILFIDGDHSFYGASVDLKLATMLSEKNKLIVFMDDVNNPGVKRAITFFRSLHNIVIHNTSCPDLVYFKL